MELSEQMQKLYNLKTPDFSELAESFINDVVKVVDIQNGIIPDLWNIIHLNSEFKISKDCFKVLNELYRIKINEKEKSNG